MPFSYTFDAQTRTFTLYPDGIGTWEDAIRLASEVSQHKDFDQRASILYDARERKTPLPPREVLKIVQFLAAESRFENHRFAIVATHSRIRIAANLFCTIARVWGLKASVFKDLDRAHAWLQNT
jgi:hypothetical protein